MERTRIPLLFTILALISIVVSICGCASVKTVTTTQIQTRVANETATVPTTIITTITQIIGGQTETSEVTLTGVPPMIPHGTDIQGDYGACFICHPIPPGHTGRVANENTCGQCHEQGPIAPNLVP